jgi:hypothetical protein
LSAPEPTEDLLVLFGERAKASPALIAPVLDSIKIGPTKAGIKSPPLFFIRLCRKGLLGFL